MTRYKSDVILPELYDSKVEEKNILNFWRKEKIFEKVREARQNNESLSFYSGPVFPTGYPHSGHILNSVIKDAFTRYGHKKNLKVDSRFGWDCHGIPLEHEVEKKLGIKSPADIEIMGVAKYNEECEKFVDKHAVDWRNVFERTGNWMEFENEYHTMSTEYMERVWWVFKQLFEKGLVYNATKVMPYSSSCFTHLSNFEAEQNCKEVTETGYTIVVTIADSSEKLLLWTTTPSSLASNVAVCINPKSVYVKVKAKQKGGEEVVYILSKNSLPFLFPLQSDYTLVDEFLGIELKDLKYEPLFERKECECELLTNEFIADDIGSGIVLLDDIVIDSLKQRGLIFKVEDVTYKKSFCWRSDTPLRHKRVNSWHIRVEGLVEDLLKNTSEIEWCSNGDEEISFKAWLKEHCKDWTIGRTRYWGTPIPIWSSPSGDEIVCVGSIEELKKLTGKTNVTNIHREFVDWMVIPSKTPGNPPLRRISEVFDCWFESGAVPFALRKKGEETLTVDVVAEGSDQVDKTLTVDLVAEVSNNDSDQGGDQAEETLTVDFVAEGRDQSHCWFYTMLVLSTALSKPSPFRNIVTTGLVLTPDGSKVSKRRHNHNDPMRLIEKYGADAFRLYLLSSPLVAGKDVDIQEAGVAHITEAVIQPLWRIFKHCSSRMGSKSWVNYGYVRYWEQPVDIMDAFILSSIEGLLKFYCEEMNAYRLQNIVPKVITLLQQVEDWYIPFRKPNPNHQISVDATTTILFNIIYTLCLMLAPFAPFITEYIYQKHREYVTQYLRLQSIHEALLYPPMTAVIAPEVELRVSRMQFVVGLVRTIRTRHVIPNQYKISELVVVHHNESYRNDIILVKDLIAEIVNAHELRVTEDHHEFEATLKAVLRADSTLYQNQEIAAAVKELGDEDVSLLIREEKISVLGQTVSMDDILITYKVGNKLNSNLALITEHDLIVAIRMNKELLYYEEGSIKEILNHIKNLKRKGNYYPNEKVTIFYSTKDKCLKHLMSKHWKHLNVESKSDLRESTCDTNGSAVDGHGRIEEIADIKGNTIKLHLVVKSDSE